MSIYIPAKIRRMSKRRQKIAIRRRLISMLQIFEGKPTSPEVIDEIVKATWSAVAPWTGIHFRIPLKEIRYEVVKIESGSP